MVAQVVHYVTVAVTEMFTEHNLFRTRDLDEAREQVAKVFCPHKLTTADRSGAVNTVHNSVKQDSISLNYLDYGAEVHIQPGELGSFFLVQIPLSGGSYVRCGDQEVYSDQNTASIPNPTEKLEMTWLDESPHLLVHIPRLVLENRLSELIQRDLTVPLRFELGMDLTAPKVSGWRQIVDLLAKGLNGNQCDFHVSVRSQLEDMVITGLLTSHNHNYSACISSPAEPLTPRSVRVVVEHCHDLTDRTPTVAELANLAGVSVRSLQEAFKTHVGLSPMEYLRDYRLRQVNKELISSNSTFISVSEVATFWGFTHLGRFSQQYFDRFGELPSATFRNKS